MCSVGIGIEANDLGVDIRATRECMVAPLENDGARTLTDNKPVAITIERAW